MEHVTGLLIRLAIIEDKGEDKHHRIEVTVTCHDCKTEESFQIPLGHVGAVVGSLLQMMEDHGIDIPAPQNNRRYFEQEPPRN